VKTKSRQDQVALSSFGSLTRLQAATASVNSQPTRAVSRCRVCGSHQPNPSSIRFLSRWLAA
jgi:hypothetical protein